MNIVKQLRNYQDQDYRSFQIKLMPTLSPQTIIGVRTPDLRMIAEALYGTPMAEEFMSEIPHEYFEENQVHAFLISLEKNFDKCVENVEDLLPYIDNWATCDQLKPGALKKHKAEFIPYIYKWIKSKEPYTVRFAIGTLMDNYLNDEDFKPEYLGKVAEVRSDHYYVNMMIAWYFATALSKQWDASLPYLTEDRLDKWVHNRTIQKAIESHRISNENKEYLRKLKK